MAGSASRLCPMLAPLTDIDSLLMSTSHQQQLLQQSRNVSISAKLKCHSAASLGA
jgi:hypothetical protein